MVIVFGNVVVIFGFCIVCVSSVLIGMMKISSRKIVSGVISSSVIVCLWVLVVFSLCLSVVVDGEEGVIVIVFNWFFWLDMFWWYVV